MKIVNFYTKSAINNQQKTPTLKQLVAVEAYKSLFIAFILIKKKPRQWLYLQSVVSLN